MAKKIRLGSGEYYPTAARHDLRRKLHLVHVYMLLAKCGYTWHGKCMLIVDPHRGDKV